MNLVRAEIGRLTARRFVQLMLVLLIAAFGITVATTLAGSHQPTARELASAEAQADRQRRESVRWYEECLAAQRPDAPESYPGQYPENCAQVDPARINAADYLNGVFVFERQILSLTYFLVAFLALFGFLVGASYIGADLTSGGMTNLLLWRPQRMVVLGTKLGTVLAGVLGVSLLASALYLGAFFTIAQVRGLPGTLDSLFWSDFSLTALRGLLLVLMATALGFAVATLGRHTSAALGVVAAYAVVWEAGARIVMEIVDFSRPDQWMLSTYLAAWMDGEIRLWGSGGCSYLGRCDGSYTITWADGLLVLLVVVGALTAAAFAAFRRRDLA